MLNLEPRIVLFAHPSAPPPGSGLPDPATKRFIAKYLRQKGLQGANTQRMRHWHVTQATDSGTAYAGFIGSVKITNVWVPPWYGPR